MLYKNLHSNIFKLIYYMYFQLQDNIFYLHSNIFKLIFGKQY